MFCTWYFVHKSYGIFPSAFNVIFSFLIQNHPLYLPFDNKLLAMRQDSTRLLNRTDKLEFFQLDEIDRRVFFWLTSQEKLRRSIPSWLDFLQNDYRRRLNIDLDVHMLFRESQLCADVPFGHT